MTGWRVAVVWLAAALGMGLTFSLGRWQLARAAEKNALAQALAQQQRQPALDTAALARPMDDAGVAAVLQRQASISGQWLPEYTVFLDNRALQRRAGFHVLTPLRLQSGDAVVLVQRGWAPRHAADRTALPPVHTPAGVVQVSGRLMAQPSQVWALGQAEQAGVIRQNLDVDAFRAETGLPLARVVLWQTGAPSDGLRRDWPAPGSGVEKHYGYAFQWFGLCALTGLLFLWFQVVRPIRRPRHP